MNYGIGQAVGSPAQKQAYAGDIAKIAPAGPLTANIDRLGSIASSISKRLEELDGHLTRLTGPHPPYNHGTVTSNGNTVERQPTVQALSNLCDQFADLDTTLSQHVERLRGAF